MALCVGFSTFADLLVGKTVTVKLYSDTKGAEVGGCLLSDHGAFGGTLHFVVRPRQ